MTQVLDLWQMLSPVGHSQNLKVQVLFGHSVLRIILQPESREAADTGIW